MASLAPLRFGAGASARLRRFGNSLALAAVVPLTYATHVPPGGHGALDTPAVWIAPDPARDLLFVTDKTMDYIEIHDPVHNVYLGRLGGTGTEPGRLRRPNACAVVYGVPSNNGPIDVLFVVERDNHRVTAYVLPYAFYIGSIGATDLAKPMGIAVHWEGPQPQIWITDIGPNPQRVVVFDVVPVPEGLSGVRRRTIAMPANAVLESITVDDVNGRALVCDEAAGDVMVYDLQGNLTARFGAGHFVDQTEGLQIFDTGGGTGYVIVTDQQADPVEWEVFDRRDFRWLRQIVGHSHATDGITIVQQPMPNFPYGSFYASSSDNAVDAYAWQDIAAATELCLAGPCAPVDVADPATAARPFAGGFPTPFRGSGALHFRLAQPGDVDVTVYDLRGAVVAQLAHAARPAGLHAIAWDGRGRDGVPLPSGVYLVRARLGGTAFTQKLTLVR